MLVVCQLCTASRIFPDFLQSGNVRCVINPCRYSFLRLLQLFHCLILLIPPVCVSARSRVFWVVYIRRDLFKWGGCGMLDKMVKYCAQGFWGRQVCLHPPVTARSEVEERFFVWG